MCIDSSLSLPLSPPFQGITKLQDDLKTGPQSDMFQSNIYCRLGHLHLLLEEYHEGMSNYIDIVQQKVKK